MVKPIIHCPVHFGTFNVWHEHAWNGLRWSKLMKWESWVKVLLWGWWLFLTVWNHFISLGQVVFPTGRILGCLRHYWSSNDHIFTQAEFEAVLSSFRLWIWDYRTPPSMNIKQYLLYKLYTSLNHKCHSVSYIFNLAKVISVLILLGLWWIVLRPFPGLNIQYLLKTRCNLKSSCRKTWKIAESFL